MSREYNIVVSHDELMYVWDETHATNNFAIMTKLILQCGMVKGSRNVDIEENEVNNVSGPPVALCLSHDLKSS